MANNQIICGPKVHRSTEFSYIQDMTNDRGVIKINQYNDFYHAFTQAQEVTKDRLNTKPQTHESLDKRENKFKEKFQFLMGQL